MELSNVAPKESSRIPRKPERTYTSSLKSCSMEARRRPLRTYSKRTALTESSEPVAKRQCLPVSSITSIQEEEARQLPPVPESRATTSSSKPSPPSLPPIKKGTITAYFGRAAAPPPPPVVTSSSDPPSDPLSEPNALITTPPSSPPTITATKRKVRRLKTRAVARRIFENKDGDREQEVNEEDEKQTGETSDVRNRESSPANPAPMAALSEIAPNTLNEPEQEGDKPQQRKRKREKQKKKTPSVQTTLSLSMREEALYTECKECGMLYNHLHPTDVRYHARRHAALMKVKAQTAAETEGDE